MTELTAADMVDSQYDGQVGEPQRRRLQPYHWSELHLRPKREPLIKGILDRGAASLLYGETNSGKTFVGLDMGVHVAHSPSWRDHKVRQGIVCYIAAEGGLGLEERLTAYRLHHDINEAGIPLYILPASVDLCSSDADTTEMVDELKRLGHVEFIIIDTLSRVLAGGKRRLGPLALPSHPHPERLCQIPLFPYPLDLSLPLDLR